MSRNKKRDRTEEKLQRLVRKIVVLAYYSKERKLPRCCWHGCSVTHIDSLTLDHLASDGNLNKLPCGRRRGGDGMYRWIVKHNFPRGYQTLCASHQTQKENRRRREQ